MGRGKAVVRALRAICALNWPDKPHLGPTHSLPIGLGVFISSEAWPFTPCLTYILGMPIFSSVLWNDLRPRFSFVFSPVDSTISFCSQLGSLEGRCT